MPIIERYYTSMPTFLVFGTLDVGCFLVYGVLNAKILAFSTLDANAQPYLYSTQKLKSHPEFGIQMCNRTQEIDDD